MLDPGFIFFVARQEITPDEMDWTTRGQDRSETSFGLAGGVLCRRLMMLSSSYSSWREGHLSDPGIYPMQLS